VHRTPACCSAGNVQFAIFGADATAAITWLMGKVLKAIADDEPPRGFA
jgi:hypothetical protein